MSGLTELVPENETELEEIVLSAASSNQPMEIVGGGSKRGYGRPVDANVLLSTRALTGILAYQSAEMVMTVRAGTPMAQIEAALAAENQMLAFEPVDLAGLYGNPRQATAGGAFSAGLSGPRRFVAGAMRDAALGVRFVNGGGEAVKAGGRVMKNVTGLDIVKLITGANGTLGILTELTFKVLPRPERSVTLMVAGGDEQVSVDLMAQIMGLSLDVNGAACLPESCRSRFGQAFGEGAVTALRLEGPAFSVSERVKRLADHLARAGTQKVIEGDESAALWAAIRDASVFAADRTKPLWRVSLPPSAAAQFLLDLRMETAVDAYLDWQGGLIWMQMDAFADGEIVRRQLERHGGGHATLIRASAQDLVRTPVFQPRLPAVEALEERVRRAFDPRAIFNPGRMT